MNINREYITKINFTDKNDTGRIKYIVIHYFGSLASVLNLGKYWASSYAGASAHYGVGHAGEVFQFVEDDDIAWHCGASSYVHTECRNTNSIGIEMAVKKKDTSTLSASDKDWYFTEETVAAAVELTRTLMKKYNIPADHVIRHYDVTGKICPNPYVFNVADATWDKFKAMISEENQTEDYTKIMGSAVATADQIAAYMIKVNPNTASFTAEMAKTFIEEGIAEGVRGDIAAAQTMLETGNLEFKGSAVTIDQNNFCGMGVTSNGMKGNSFASMREGIRAQIQHLKAYASTADLNNDCVDPRFKYVSRGCAKYVEWLGQKENPNGKGWAAGAGYGEKILTILAGIIGQQSEGQTTTETKGDTTAVNALSGYAKIIYEGADGVNYRSVPDYNAQSAGVAMCGEVFTIVGETGDFYKLKSGWYLTKRADLVQYTEKITSKKSVEELAKEVIAGKWGNGEARKTSLTAAGYSFEEVQKKVNEMLK